MEVANNSKNESMKKLTFVFVFLLIVLILVLFRSTSKNIFKNDAETVIQSTENNSNIIKTDQIKDSEFLIVDLSEPESFEKNHPQNAINIPFKNLLEKDNQKILKSSKSKIVLYCQDISTSAKAYTLLNQMGIQNIYILETGDDEVLKYKFRPDTTIRPESAISIENL